MAWIEKRAKANGTTYLVRWYEPSGRVVSTRRRTYDEARALKAEMESAILKGIYVANDVRKMPFREYAKLILDSDGRLAPSTRENYDNALRIQLGPLGLIPIEHIDPARVRSLFAALVAKGTSPHVLHMTRKTLSKVCSVAVEDGILNRNPARAVSVPTPARRQVEPLTPEQVQNVSEAVSGRWKAAVLLGGWGGLRIGEVGALDAGDIDWERGSVRVWKSVGKDGKLKQTKTTASNRVVVLPKHVMKVLAEHILQYVNEDKVGPGDPGTVRGEDASATDVSTQGGKPAPGRAQATPTSPLFLTKYGNRITGMTIAPIMRKTGVRFHDLRHTQAALLIKMGAHPREIMERMGHASITITMNTYGWLFPAAHDDLARRLEESYEPKELGKVIEL